MRAGKRMLAIALTGCLFLSGCAGTQAPMETTPPTQMTQAPTEPTAEPTQAPTETQPVPTGLHSMAQLALLCYENISILVYLDELLYTLRKIQILHQRKGCLCGRPGFGSAGCECADL